MGTAHQIIALRPAVFRFPFSVKGKGKGPLEDMENGKKITNRAGLMATIIPLSPDGEGEG